MKAVSGYSEAKAINFNASERLPAGGYVLKILAIKEESYDWGEVIIFRFDIAEGEYKGFFDKQYKNMPDEYKKWKGTYRLNIPTKKGESEEDTKKYKRSLGFFKSQIEAFNKSNGINIDCSKEWSVDVLKSKLVGAVFGNKEWEMNGRSGWFTNCDHLISIEDIHNDNFTIPKDKPLKNSAESTVNSVIDADDFEIGESEQPVPF